MRARVWKPVSDTHVCNQMLFAVVDTVDLGFTLRDEVVLLDVLVEQQFL